MFKLHSLGTLNICYPKIMKDTMKIIGCIKIFAQLICSRGYTIKYFDSAVIIPSDYITHVMIMDVIIKNIYTWLHNASSLFISSLVTSIYKTLWQIVHRIVGQIISPGVKERSCIELDIGWYRIHINQQYSPNIANPYQPYHIGMGRKPQFWRERVALQAVSERPLRH